jgi:hypothetical protein
LPAELDWLDRDRQIFAIRLFDPFSPLDFEPLEDELASVVETQLPIYVLLDIRHFVTIEALTQIGTSVDRPYLPELSPEQRERSRLAVLGGGAFVKLIFGLVENAADDLQFIRQFEHEDEAFTWLSDCAMQT